MSQTTLSPAGEALLSAIGHNVGDPQPPMIGAQPLFTTAVANGPLDVGPATQAMDTLVANGHVIRWTDGTGTVRYGLTDVGIDTCPRIEAPVLSAADVDALREYVATEASRENPDTAFIGWANGHIEHL